MEIPKARLEKMLDKHVVETLGKDFTFRPQQKEAILDILGSFFDGQCNLYLLDAPTGSGKSLIAMIVAGFLTNYKMRGYILASDLSLQSQYEKDFRRYNLQWGSIKGVDNYTCVVNSEKFSLGDCRLKNTSYEVAESLPCFGDCGYLMSRKIAIKSPVSLLNYSYWLIQRNYVEGKMQDKGKGVPFPKRDFTLCDEAHRISDIVQNHFSPRVDERTVDKLERLRGILKKNNLSTPKSTTVRVRSVVKNMFRENDPGKVYALLKEFEMQLSDFVRCGSSVKDHVAKLFPGNAEVPKEWRTNLGLVDWVKDCHCKFEDYNHIISQVGVESMVKNPQGEQVVFNCLDESYMMERHFHSQSGFKLLMTATMGDPGTFLKTIGAKDARYFRMDSNFDYTRSPIYYFPKRRMSKAQKDRTLPWVIHKMGEILDNHPQESGIVHSGSYENSMRIFESLSPENKERVLVYQGTQEKEKVLEKFLSEKNMVLMGPSILEGLDLASERSRFQVFVKVPYPSLGDKFVSAKMNYQPEWYSWKACNGVLQGVGRSVRSKDDWCITYFLDGCLSDLFRHSRRNFPQEFLQRVKVVES